MAEDEVVQTLEATKKGESGCLQAFDRLVCDFNMIKLIKNKITKYENNLFFWFMDLF